jgi:hypothetical protein
MDEETKRASWNGPRALSLVLVAAAIPMLAVWLVMAVGHLRDRSLLSHVSGEWMGLAFYAKSGVLYPPSYQDGFYGGTRYGAVPIALYAMLYALAGDPILSGKLLSLAGMGILLASLWLLVRRVGGSAGLGAVAGALLLQTTSGWLAGLNISADALAAAVQVLALLAAQPKGSAPASRLAPVVAGALCAVAFFVKVNAISATVGIGLFYLITDRRSLRRFVVAGSCLGALLAAEVWVASGGRVLDGFGQQIFAGRGATSFLGVAALANALVAVLYGLHRDAVEAWALVPACAVIIGLAAARRRLTLIQVTALVALALTVTFFTNPGIASNHLVDLVCLLVLVVAEAGAKAWTSLTAGPAEALAATGAAAPDTVFLLCALSLLWLSATAFQVSGHVGQAREAVRLLLGRERLADTDQDPASWNRVFRREDRVLSSDASLPVLMRQRPVVLSSFMLKIVVDSHPEAREALARRLDAREFDWVVSVAGIRDRWLGRQTCDNEWGPEIVDAIDRNYQRAGQFWGYALYRPKGRGVGGSIIPTVEPAGPTHQR